MRGCGYVQILLRQWYDPCREKDSEYADTVKSLADCDGLKVAVKEGATSYNVAQSFLDENPDVSYEIVQYKDTVGCVSDLLAGRVDVVVNDLLNQKILPRNMKVPRSCVIHLPMQRTPSPYRREKMICLHLSMNVLTSIMQTALMIHSGQMDRCFRRGRRSSCSRRCGNR